MSYGNRIAYLRKQHHYTQAELAELLGITRPALSHYELDRREPDYDTLTRIADLFNVSIDYVLGRVESPHSKPAEPIHELLGSLELSDTELLSQFALTIDGKPITEEEAKRFIDFIRSQRSVSTRS